LLNKKEKKMKEKVYEFVSGILSISIEELRQSPNDFRLSSPNSWDSLAHLAIMTELEELLDKELSIDEMEELDSLQKIINFVK
jgi:acyl carrier protein